MFANGYHSPIYSLIDSSYLSHGPDNFSPNKATSGFVY